MRYFITFWLILGCAVGHDANADQAVLSFIKEGGRHYTVTFLDEDLRAYHELKLGKLKAPVRGQWNRAGTTFWYSARASSEKEWTLVGYDPRLQHELVRIPIGKRSPAHIKLGRTWSEESDDGRYLFVLTLVKNEWHIESYSTGDYKKLASTPIDKGHIELTQIADNKILAVSDHLNFGNKRVYVVDPLAGKVLFEEKISNSKKPAAVLAPAQDFIYLSTQNLKEFKNPDDPRYKIFARKTNLRVIEVASGKVVNDLDVGYDLTPVHAELERDSLYAASSDSATKGGLTIWRLAGEQVTKFKNSKEECKPVSAIVDESQDRATVFCKRTAVHFDADQSQAVKVGFAARNAVYAKTSQSVYMLERGGSEIGKLDLAPLKFVADHGTGRGGVKFGQALASVAGIAVGAYTGYAVIMIPSYRSTAFATDEDETKVYVLNGGTSDVTIVDAHSFDKLGYIPTGAGSFALTRYEQSPYVFALALTRVTALDTASEEPALVLEKGAFVGANGDLDRLYWAPKGGGLEVYSLTSLERLEVLPDLENVYAVPTAGREPTQFY